MRLGSRLCLAIALPFLLVSTTIEGAPADGVILLEGESYVASHDLGGYSIHIVSCQSASGGYAADGIDQPGEWIELDLTLAGTHGYAARLALQGWPDETSTLHLTLIPQAGGDAPTADFSHTGSGVGCEVPYTWAEGDGLLWAPPGDYRARIELVTGTLSRVDLLELSWDESAMAPRSWGAVKSLYR
jgi:hypothetical protein